MMLSLIVGALVLALFAAIPLAIALPELRQKDKKWVCPSCDSDAFTAHCRNCGASMRANPSYAGFRKRFAATLADSAVLFLPVILATILQRQAQSSRFVWWFSGFSLSLFSYSYVLYFTSRYGQTPGKYLVGIRIMTLRMKPIGVRDALKRESLNLTYSVLVAITNGLVLMDLSGNEFGMMTLHEKIQLWHGPLGSGLRYISGFLVWSELWILLTNKKRRALHDYIAGTVVVDEKTLKRRLPPKYRFRWWPTT
jgi:uncharacterized RDD family membrane protein YckC